jgi:uncharacterized delta-60 repeat protein
MVGLLPDGRIVLGGSTRSTGSPSDPRDFAAARYLPNGAPDPDFSGDGKVVTSVAAGTDLANGGFLQPDGKLVLVGQARRPSGTSNDFAVVRYTHDGALDPSFDGDGLVTTPIGVTAQANGATLGPGGKIVVVGEVITGAGDQLFALARYLPSGALDPGFGGGTQAFSAGSDTEAGFGVAIQDDGKIVATGFSIQGGKTKFATIRLTA